MSICGIDFSSHFIDIVLLDEDSDAATWHQFELTGQDAFERARAVRAAMPGSSFWDDVLAVGIEQPRGHHGVTALMRVQGAVLACLPPSLLVQPWNPSAWRKACGLKGNASKFEVGVWATWDGGLGSKAVFWPQDAIDAYAIGWATRSLVETSEAAA